MFAVRIAIKESPLVQCPQVLKPASFLEKVRRASLLLAFALLGLAAMPLFAQDAAVLGGSVADPSGAMVPDAAVSVISARTGALYSVITNTQGQFNFESLPPGEYSLEVEKQGFSKLHLDRVVLDVRDRQSLKLSLAVSAAASTVVTVTAEVRGVSADASTGTVLEQNYLESLPLNDRSIQSLVLMSPGVTSDAGAGPGDIHVNGLRANTNYYTLDGVSVAGIGDSQSGATGTGGVGLGPGAGFGGGGPIGGGVANYQPALDSLQEVRVQTSAFAPEFGRSPGAQVVLSSRGGTDKFHGSLYEYFRNGDLNAHQFFANAFGLPATAMQLNRYGATFGGPILKKQKTYFFLNYEGFDTKTPQTAIDSVPDLTTRNKAPVKDQPFLAAFPIPNGPELGSGAAQFYGVFSNPFTTRSGSMRVDHTFNSGYTIFARYSYTGLGGNTRDVNSPNTVTNSNFLADAFTVGFLATPNPHTINDLRASFSLTGSSAYSTMDNFGGAVPLTNSLVFPSGINQTTGQFNFQILGSTGYSFGYRSKNRQDQFNVIDGVTLVAGSHSYKLGVDVRRITPTYYRQLYDQSVIFNGIPATNTGGLLTGLATNAVVDSNLTEVYPEFFNFSAYLQDTWKVASRLTVTYGLRWDVNPAPGVREGPRPIAVTNNQYFPLAQSQPLYDTQWHNIAPRVGVAYQLSTKQGHETIVRFGWGWFYDVGYGLINSVFSSVPYTNASILTLPVFPLSAANAAPPGLNPVQPYARVSAAVNNLEAPLVEQATLSVEHYFGRSQSLTVGVVHTTGSNLLLSFTEPAFTTQYDLLSQISNGGSSEYNSLQVQYRRRLSARLQVQAAWTWAHSLDTSSNDAGFGAGFASFSGGAKGNSDFDIRHNVTVTGFYQIPSANGWGLHGLTKNWFAEWNAIARTGLPFDVVGVSASTSNAGTTDRSGVFGQSRPDLTGAPIWIDDPKSPGGRRLNSAAFSTPTGYAEGDLGRNALRGFGAAQLDFSIRRKLALTERVSLNLSAEAYNIFNHPSFANPTRTEGANLSSPNFGVVTQTLNQALGSGTSVTAIGGARTLEFVVRLQF